MRILWIKCDLIAVLYYSTPSVLAFTVYHVKVGITLGISNSTAFYLNSDKMLRRTLVKESTFDMAINSFVIYCHMSMYFFLTILLQ